MIYSKFDYVKHMYFPIVPPGGQGSRWSGEQVARGAGGQRSRWSGQQVIRGADSQGSRWSGEQVIRGADG